MGGILMSRYWCRLRSVKVLVALRCQGTGGCMFRHCTGGILSVKVRAAFSCQGTDGFLPCQGTADIMLSRSTGGWSVFRALRACRGIKILVALVCQGIGGYCTVRVLPASLGQDTGGSVAKTPYMCWSKNWWHSSIKVRIVDNDAVIV